MKQIIIAGALATCLLSGCATRIQDSPTADFIQVKDGFLSKQTYGVDNYGNLVPFTKDEAKILQELSPAKRDAYINKRVIDADPYSYRTPDSPPVADR